MKLPQWIWWAKRKINEIGYPERFQTEPDEIIIQTDRLVLPEEIEEFDKQLKLESFLSRKGVSLKKMEDYYGALLDEEFKEDKSEISKRIQERFKAEIRSLLLISSISPWSPEQVAKMVTRDVKKERLEKYMKRHGMKPRKNTRKKYCPHDEDRIFDGVSHICGECNPNFDE